jgi:NAD(P)H dehydrogenase (quinone)
MILVSGANGGLGKAITQALKVPFLKGSSTLPEDPYTRRVDFNSPGNMNFSGIKKLLIISTMAEHRYMQHKNAIDAAKAQGVKHIVYTSTALKNIQTSHVKDLMYSHFQTEEYLKQSGLKYTIVRNTMYAEAIPQILHPLKTGEFLPSGLGKVPFALRSELGEAIAAVLSLKGHENKTYHLMGDTAYSFEEVVRAKQPQTQVFKTLAVEEYERRLHALPDIVKYLYKGTVLDILDGQYEIPQDAITLGTLLGRPTANLKRLLSI